MNSLKSQINNAGDQLTKLWEKKTWEDFIHTSLAKSRNIDKKLNTYRSSRIGKFLISSTPGHYILSMVLVLGLLTASLISLEKAITDKGIVYQRILNQSIKLNSTARLLYTSLSDMDQEVAHIAASKQLDQNSVSKIYDDYAYISQALVYIGEHSQDANPHLSPDLTSIISYLPRYIRLTDTIIESNVHPADTEMILTRDAQISDTYLLPAARSILYHNTELLNRESAQATHIPYFSLLITITALLALSGTYLLVKKKSGRKTNLGLLIALLLTLLQSLWITGAGFTGTLLASQARDLGISDLSHQNSLIVHGHQARRDELLKASLPLESYKYKQKFIADLKRINNDIYTYHPHTASGEIFLINIDHTAHTWSKIAASFNRYTTQPTPLSSPLGLLDAYGNLPQQSQFLFEIALTSQDWTRFNLQINHAIDTATNSYTSTAHHSYNIWTYTILAAYLCGIASIIASTLGILTRLREFKK